MSEYIPQVGDTVRGARWTAHEQSVTVTAVGTTRFLADDDTDGECAYALDAGWVKVEPTPADRYVVFDEHGPVNNVSYAGIATARAYCAVGQRVARFTFAEWIDQ